MNAPCLWPRDQPIMLIFYLLCYAAVLIKIRIVLSLLSLLQICMNKSLLTADNLESLFVTEFTKRGLGTHIQIFKFKDM